MSILLAGVVTPTINGFQILGFVTTNTYIDFAFAQTENTEDTEDTAEDETEDTAEDETEDVDDEDDIRSLGQDVSDFVHDASDEFRTQKEETKAIIAACRVALQDAVLEEQKDIRMQCREDLNEVRESYQELRRTYHDVFKEFRVHVRAIMSGDDIVSTIDAINLRAQQEESTDRIHDLRMQMREELKTEVDDLRKQMREEREKMREEMQNLREEGGDNLKEELQSMREKMKEESEKMKEQMKEEREKMKEQMKEEREKMKEESEKTRESEEKSN
jgi:chromosome segregation ATPase